MGRSNLEKMELELKAQILKNKYLKNALGCQTRIVPI